MVAAAIPASVPGRETAPSVPGGTGLRVVIWYGVRRNSCPTSDSAVSAKAAPREATNAAAKDFCRRGKDGEYGADHGHPAVRERVAGSSTAAPGFGDAPTLLAPVADPGERRAPGNKKCQHRKAR